MVDNDNDCSLLCVLLYWLGSLVVKSSDLRLNGREFDPRPKTGWLIPFVDKRVGDGQVKLCDPSLTRAILSALEMSSHANALNKCSVFNFNFNVDSL